MYNPADHKVQNQPFGVGAIPLNGKSHYFDTAKQVYRWFQNVAELEAYFAIQFKTPDFECIVNTGGTLNATTGKITGGTNDAYWFPNGATAILKNTNINLADYYTKSEINALDSAITNNINTHKGDTNNPHSVTKSQIGLGNVDNTSDLDKPVSTQQETAIQSVSDQIVNIEEINYDQLESDHKTYNSSYLAGKTFKLFQNGINRFLIGGEFTIQIEGGFVLSNELPVDDVIMLMGQVSSKKLEIQSYSTFTALNEATPRNDGFYHVDEDDSENGDGTESIFISYGNDLFYNVLIKQ